MMTDDELAQIAARVSAFQRSHDEAHFLLKMDARTLLREVERLRAREAALVAVVRDLATLADGADESMNEDDDEAAAWVTYEDVAPLAEKARALLAATEPIDATTAERE